MSQRFNNYVTSASGRFRTRGSAESASSGPSFQRWLKRLFRGAMNADFEEELGDLAPATGSPASDAP